jgi:hypothetical protein
MAYSSDDSLLPENMEKLIINMESSRRNDYPWPEDPVASHGSPA